MDIHHRHSGCVAVTIHQSRMHAPEKSPPFPQGIKSLMFTEYPFIGVGGVEGESVRLNDLITIQESQASLQPHFLP